MQKQLESLEGGLTSGLSHLQFHVAPITLASPGALGGPFAVLEFANPRDQDVVYLEGRDSATYLESDAQVQQYKTPAHGSSSWGR